MPQLSRYHTLHVEMREMREMRIWPQYAAKCCKNAGKFFPDEGVLAYGSHEALVLVLGIKYLAGFSKQDNARKNTCRNGQKCHVKRDYVKFPLARTGLG